MATSNLRRHFQVNPKKHGLVIQEIRRTCPYLSLDVFEEMHYNVSQTDKWRLVRRRGEEIIRNVCKEFFCELVGDHGILFTSHECTEVPTTKPDLCWTTIRIMFRHEKNSDDADVYLDYTRRLEDEGPRTFLTFVSESQGRESYIRYEVQKMLGGLLQEGLVREGNSKAVDYCRHRIQVQNSDQRVSEPLLAIPVSLAVLLVDLASKGQGLVMQDSSSIEYCLQSVRMNLPFKYASQIKYPDEIEEVEWDDCDCHTGFPLDKLKMLLQEGCQMKTFSEKNTTKNIVIK